MRVIPSGIVIQRLLPVVSLKSITHRSRRFDIFAIKAPFAFPLEMTTGRPAGYRLFGSRRLSRGLLKNPKPLPQTADI